MIGKGFEKVFLKAFGEVNCSIGGYGCCDEVERSLFISIPNFREISSNVIKVVEKAVNGKVNLLNTLELIGDIPSL